MKQYTCHTKRFSSSGAEVLRCRISLPFWEERAGMSQFYGAIAQQALSFCERELFPMAEADFFACEDPKKRFSFPFFLYTLEGRVTWEDPQRDWVTVRLNASLRRRGGAELLARGTDAHAWHCGEDCLIPPEQIAAELGGRRLIRRERKRGAGVWMEQGNLWVCVEGECHALEEREKKMKNRQN